MTGPFKMKGWSGYQSSPAKQTDKAKIAEAKEESKAQEAKGENEGQQIIGKVDRGEITQEEGNKQLKVLQDAQNKPQ
jgi:hypothetical protein